MTFKLLYVPGHCCGYNWISCQLLHCQTVINNINHCASKKSQRRQLVLKKNVSNSVSFQFGVGHFLLLRKFSCFQTDHCNVSQNRLRMRYNTCFLSDKDQQILCYVLFCFVWKKGICLLLKIKTYSKLNWRGFFPSNLTPWRRWHLIKTVRAEGRGSMKAQKRWNRDKQSSQDFWSAPFLTVHSLTFPLLFIAALFPCSLVYLMRHHSDCAFIPSKWSRLLFLHTKDTHKQGKCWYGANTTALVLKTLFLPAHLPALSICV